MGNKETITRNPFKFLSPFTEDEGESFKGRNDEIDLLYDMVRRRNILLVFGESGVGKTSLIQCGLANKFQSADWYDVLILRENNINNSFKAALVNHIQDKTTDKNNLTIPQLIDVLYVENFKPIYLIFDQLEELFVTESEEDENIRAKEINDFYDTIGTILKTKSNCCKIIFVIREEFHAKLNDFEGKVAPLFNTGLKINKMKSLNAEEVVTKALEENASVVEASPGIAQISKLIVEASTNNGVVNLLKLQVLLHVLYNDAPLKENTQVRLFTKSLIQSVTKIEDLLKDYVSKIVRGIDKENESDIWNLLSRFITNQNTKKACLLNEILSIPALKLDIESCIGTLEEKQILQQMGEGQYLGLMHDCLVPVIQDFLPKNKRPRLLQPVITGNPYKGLASYNEADSKIFYGRQEVINELYEKVNKESLIPIIGASGAGKSSLIKAGLLPKFRKEGFCILPVIKPGKSPEQSIPTIITAITQALDGTKYILYIDQFEEVVSQCEDPVKRGTFINFIKDILEQPYSYFNRHIELKVLLSVRSDFEPQVEPLFLGEYWIKGRYTVPPFSKDQLREIIEEPAYLAGLEFSPSSLVDTIVGEVDRSNNLLPLLSYTLNELYTYNSQRKNDGVITQDDYNTLGGVIGGLSKRANSIYDKLDDRGKILMQNIFIRMLSLSSGEWAGRRAADSEFVYVNEAETKKVYDIIDTLVKSRLIICSKDSNGGIFYEPAHDSLIRSWNRLWEWLNREDGKEALSLQSQLRGALLSYKEGVLWDTNKRLDLLEEEINSADNWLNKQEVEFVLASISKRNEKEQIRKRNEEDIKLLNERTTFLLEQKLLQEKKSKRRLVIGLLGLGVLLITSIISLGKNYYQAQAETIANDSLKITLRDNKILLKQTDSLASISANLLVRVKAQSEKNRRLADSLRLKNNDLTDTTSAYAKLNKNLMATTKAYGKLNKSLTDTAAAYAKLKQNLIIADAKNELHKDSFYFLQTSIDSFDKERFIDTLIAIRFDERNMDKYNKFRQALNIVSKASNEVNQNPNKGLALAKQAYDIYPDKIIDSIGYTIANNNLFYKYKLEMKSNVRPTAAFGFNGIYRVTLSNDKSHFAFATVGGIRIGTVENENLVVDDRVLSEYLNAKKNISSSNDLPVVALSYTNDGNLIAVTKDYKVYKWDSAGKYKAENMLKLKDDSIFYLAAISPDGKKIIRDCKDYSVEIFDLEKGKDDPIGKNISNKQNGYINKLCYSPDGGKVLITSEYHKGWILDVNSKTIKQINALPTAGKDSLIYNANFTSDGKNIIYETQDSLAISNLDGDKIGTAIYKSLGFYSGNYSSQKIFFSSDWENLVTQNLYGDGNYVEKLNGDKEKDSLYSFTDQVGKKISVTRFSVSGTFGFVDNTSILSYNNNYIDSVSPYSLLLLTRYDQYNHLPEAYASIDPYLTEKDKVDIGLKGLSEKEKYELVKKYYYQYFDYSMSDISKKDILIKAKGLLSDLISIDKENENYLDYLKLINRSLYYSPLDTNYTMYAIEIKKEIELEKNILHKYSNDTLSFEYEDYKHTLSTDYGNLSFFTIFVNKPDFPSILVNARKGLALDSTNDFIYTNMALGYLLTNDTTNAKLIYKSYRDGYSKVLKKNFETAFLEDLQQVEYLQVLKNKPEILEFARRVECWLKNEKGCSL